MGKRWKALLAAGILAVSVASCGKKGEGFGIGLGKEKTGLAKNAVQETENAAVGEGDSSQEIAGERDGAARKAGEQEGAGKHTGKVMPVAEEEGASGTEDKITVMHATEKGRIALSLPKGWAYQVKEQEGGDFSVDVHPKDEPEGVVCIQYVGFFGVCGTGLVQEDCAINGKKACKGTYDGHEYWDYIAFSGKYEGYVVNNFAGESWWGEYREQVDGILDSLSFGKDAKDVAEVVELEEGEPMEVGDSGEELCLSLQGADGDMSIHLSYAGNEIEVAGHVEWLRECYVLKPDGPYFYVLVGEGLSNDAGGTHLLKVGEGEIEECDYLDAVLREDVTQNYMEASCKVDVLGSYFGIKHYGILEDKFYTDEQAFRFFELGEGVLRNQLALLQDVPANLYGERGALEEGTVIYPTGCDTEKKEFYFEYENPRYKGEVLDGFLKYEVKDSGFGCTVEGIDEYELFEELPYAG